jgi:glycosyltransferase involved in cell wall biosynthesis
MLLRSGHTLYPQRSTARCGLANVEGSIGMRIGIVTHVVRRGDGQGRVNLEVARAASARGHEVVLIASDVSDEGLSLDGVSWVRVGRGPLPTDLLRQIWFGVGSAVAIWRRRGRLDAVLANGGITFARTDVNAVHFVHSTWARSPYHEANYARWPMSWYRIAFTQVSAWWERWAWRGARRVVAVSELVATEVASSGVPSERIVVVYNGVDDDPGDQEVTRASLGVPDAAPLLAFAGDLRTGRKNLDTLLEALTGLPGVHLVVCADVGDGAMPQLARRLAVDERVHFLGFRSDVHEVYSAADVVVLPSRYDPFSLAALEGMICGRPVIVTSCMGVAEVVGDACGVVLDDPDDVVALGEAVRAMLDDDVGRRRAGLRARVAARALTWERTGSGYLSVLEELLADT